MSGERTTDGAPESEARVARVVRETRETRVVLRLELDPSDPADPEGGGISIESGIGFLDHMLTALAFHAGWNLSVSCAGDLEVDDHHTAEDIALCLGQALRAALGERPGITRYGYAYAPLDEALARAVIDLSGRPFAAVGLALKREQLGTLATENVPHFFRSFATAAGLTLHLELMRGENDHHRCEAAFKACALALRAALARSTSTSAGTSAGVPSTKGVLA